MLVNIIQEALFLAGFNGEDSVIVNSMYSFWLPEISFVFTYGTLTFVLQIWCLLLVGINRILKNEVTTNLADVSKFVYLKFFILAIATIVALGVVRPYCFPAFQTSELNHQCVKDDTDARIYVFRWALFGIRLFVIIPIVCLVLYLWFTLRPGTTTGSNEAAVQKFLLYRQMMEVLMITQGFLYLLQTFIEWVLVFLSRHGIFQL